MAGRRSATPERDGRVRDLGSRGEGVVETDAGVVFVAGALPGERVRIAPERSRRKGRGGGAPRWQLATVLEASPDRVVAPCEVQGVCGGCPLMILSAEGQARWKAKEASEATGVAVSVDPSGTPLGYRRRARLAFAGGALGYRSARSRRVVDLERCPILDPGLDAALASLRSRLLPTLAGEGEVLLAWGRERPVVWIRTDAPQRAEAYGALRDAVDGGLLAGASLAVGGTAPAQMGDPREVAVATDGQSLVGPAFGFSQANARVNDALVARVVTLAAADGRRVLELYAGHGNLSVALAPPAAELVAVEQNEEAARSCRANLEARGLTAKVIAADAGEGARRAGSADVVVLDPPRTGARDALPALLATHPERIVYVSCDLATLRRDLGTLRSAGFEVEEAHAFDMFPQTAHLETVVLLTRPR